MKYSPLQDSKFWTLLIDAVVSLVLYFTGKYGAPGLGDDVKFVIAGIQPVALALVLGFLQRDNAEKDGESLPKFLTAKK